MINYTHNCSPPSLPQLLWLTFCPLSHRDQLIPNRPAGNPLGKRNLVRPSSLLFMCEVTFPKGARVPALRPIPVMHQVGRRLWCARKSVISARPKWWFTRSENQRAAGFWCIRATHTHTQTLLYAEGKVQWCRDGGHIQRFMVTAWELSHQIHFAQWFWQRLSRSSPARTGMTPDCDHAMATVVHQWFPSTTNNSQIHTDNQEALVRLAETTSK